MRKQPTATGRGSAKPKTIHERLAKMKNFQADMATEDAGFKARKPRQAGAANVIQKAAKAIAKGGSGVSKLATSRQRAALQKIQRRKK